MCINWLNNNSHTDIGSKIIETLASYPLLTIDDLSLKLKCSKTLVKKDLDNISMSEGGDGYLFPLDEYDTEFSTYERYLGMLQHCMVIYNTKASNKTFFYELSLVGIIMYLTLVRHRGPPEKLISACNRIGYSYRNRVLPLIFGKWSTLRKNLGPIAAYNFEILLNKEARNKSISLSVVLGGINEFYASMKSITSYNIEQMKRIYNEGEEVIFNIMKENIIKPEKIMDIEKKLQEVSLLSSYNDIARLQRDLETMNKQYFGRDNFVEALCNAFSEEIAFLYYFNLFDDSSFSRFLANPYFFSSSKYILHYQVKESHKGKRPRKYRSLIKQTSIDTFTRRKLIQIMKETDEIHAWFRTWVDDIYKFQNDVSDTILRLEF